MVSFSPGKNFSSGTSLSTHLSWMDFPPLSIGPVYFCFKGSWVVVFIFIHILIEHFVSKQWRHWSELGLHCLPMFHKKDAGLIWINMKPILFSVKIDVPLPHMPKFDMFSSTLTWKLGQSHPNPIKSSSSPTVIYMEIWFQSPCQFMRYVAQSRKHHTNPICTQKQVPVLFGGVGGRGNYLYEILYIVLTAQKVLCVLIGACL